MMYGLKALQFDSSNANASCDICPNKHLSLFTLDEYCKVYDKKYCYFSELAKEKVQLCHECMFELRHTKQFQSKCMVAQNNLESNVNIVVPFNDEAYLRSRAGGARGSGQRVYDAGLHGTSATAASMTNCCSSRQL